MKMIVDKDNDKSSLRKDFIKFRQNISNPGKNKNNPFTHSKYTDLPAVLDAIKSASKGSGLVFTQDIGTNDSGYLICRSILMGANGSIVSSPMVIPVEKATSQAYGSAETYARRYSAEALCGIAGADEDDDGDASSQPSGNNSQHQSSNGNFDGKAWHNKKITEIRNQFKLIDPNKVLPQYGKAYKAIKNKFIDKDSFFNGNVARKVINEIGKIKKAANNTQTVSSSKSSGSSTITDKSTGKKFTKDDVPF